MLTIGVLGAVEAVRDGEPLTLPSGKTTELLARLALDAGTPVRVDALVEDLWAEPTDRNTLQSKVSQLRRALGDKDLVRGTGDAYVLAVEPSAVDAVRVIAIAAAAELARTTGDHAAVAELARAGTDLFRGEVLPVAGPWATPYKIRLDETRWTLVELLMESRVALGGGGDLVAELERLVVEQPLRERLWVSLVTALYRAGRQADALAACARLRRRLVDELGLDPGPELRAVEHLVLQQSAALDPPRAAAITFSSPGNLPPAPAPLIGRVADVAALGDALTAHRLVTVVGPAGVGKTRLSGELARASTLPGGAWMVRLDSVDEGADLMRVVAETLHVTGGEHALVQRLVGAETLLFLDTCEHLIAHVAGFARLLLDSVPLLRILATSQVPLGLDEEEVHVLTPLAPDESVALFTQRAQRLRKEFALDDRTESVVEEICLSLDGLPLAIELAAARVRSLPLEEIARRLDDRFALLRDPSSHEPARRRALEAALDWSYELLFPDDQRGLWALSCFPGGATLDALERVLASLDVPADSVLDTVTRLVDRSLVRLDGAAERYRLLDSIRAYAATRLRESGALDAAASAHAAWYAERADWCAAHVRSRDQLACLAFASTERADIDAALAWCHEHDRATGGRIALGLGWTWVVLGDGRAGAARVRYGIGPDASAADRAQASLLASWLETSVGDLALARIDLETARGLAEELGNEVLAADVLRHRAFLAIQEGRPSDVLSAATPALKVYRERSNAWATAATLILSAYGSLMLGDAASARSNATEAVAIVGTIGDLWALVHARGMIGGVAEAEGRFDDAARAFDEAADAAAGMGFVGQSALHRASFARALARAGDPMARAAYERAQREAAAVADGRLGATIRLHRARLARGAGDEMGARALLEDNVQWYVSAGGGDLALLNGATLAAVRGDRESLQRILTEAQAVQDAAASVTALDGLARLEASIGERDAAVAYLAEADTLVGGAPLIDPVSRVDERGARSLLAALKGGP
ncbi:MAG: BTAD domain-containing putative transcriptional regulator [Propionibacteriaceae bacterium]